MTDYPEPKNPAEVRKIYDSLRANLPLIPRPDTFVITRTVSMLSAEDQAEIIKKVKEFTAFDKEQNDPYGEHDFIKVTHQEIDYFLKFDWYGGSEGYRVVITLMQASDY